MDIREQNLDEKELIKKIREIDQLKWDLHKILKKLVEKTGLGDVSDDWCDDVEFPIGNITIYSCNYYHELNIETEKGERDINFDLDIIREIFAEIKERDRDFDKLTKNKNKIAEDIFYSTLGKKLLKSIQENAEDE